MAVSLFDRLALIKESNKVPGIFFETLLIISELKIPSTFNFLP